MRGNRMYYSRGKQKKSYRVIREYIRRANLGKNEKTEIQLFAEALVKVGRM